MLFTAGKEKLVHGQYTALCRSAGDLLEHDPQNRTNSLHRRQSLATLHLLEKATADKTFSSKQKTEKRIDSSANKIRKLTVTLSLFRPILFHAQFLYVRKPTIVDVEHFPSQQRSSSTSKHQTTTTRTSSPSSAIIYTGSFRKSVRSRQNLSALS